MATQITADTYINDDGTVTFKGFRYDDMQKAFDAVTNPRDWKAEIMATVPGEIVLLVVAAIEFFTATIARVALNVDTMQYTIYSPGYRNGPAGDH